MNLQLHRYRKDTKEYIGSLPACIDPLESEVAGEPVYIMLENSTLVEPTFEEGKIPVFNEEKDEWELVEDHRGQVVYNRGTAEPFVITELGEIPNKYSEEKPVLIQELRTEKKHEIVTEYEKERLKKVEVSKIKIALEDRIKFTAQVASLGEDEFFPYSEGEEETVLLTKAETEYIGKYLYLRGILLSFKKDELIKGVGACKSKTEVANFKVNFSIDEEIEELIERTDEEVKEYIKERMK